MSRQPTKIHQAVAWIAFSFLGLLAIITAQVRVYPNQCNAIAMSDELVAAYRGIDVETLHLLRERRDLTTAEVCEIAPDKLARAIDKSIHPKPDHPGEAVTFRKLQEQDENGNIPEDGLIRAMEQAAQLRQTSARQPSSGGISSGKWTWLGPGNIGGRIRAILIHPTNTNTMWVGSVSGGIWKTTNGGTSWSVVSDFMANLAVSTLVMDPTNYNTLYAGTGEGFYNGDKIRGLGVFKSIDGGTTWTQLPTTNNSNWYYVNRLAISPNGTTLLAATGSGIWRSINGGDSWTQVQFSSDMADVKFNPSDNNKAVAGRFWGGAYYSTNGGLNWNTATFNVPGLTGSYPRTELAYAPSNPSIVYAGVYQTSGEVWQSVDGGQTYSRVNAITNYMGTQGWYDNAIWVDPTNANIIVVGGIDLYRSTNGGTTLTKISQWQYAPSSAHADHHAIVSHPGFNGSSNKTVFFGNDGGIYKATDVYTVIGTVGWTELNNQLGITQFYGAAGNASTGTIIGGTQDNGTLRYTTAGGTEAWTSAYGGDGGFSAADPSDSNYFYGEYVYAAVHRSSNGGSSSSYICGQYWSGVAWVWKSAPYRIDDAYYGRANFIAPFILDPNDSNRLLVGGASLWRTNDAKTANTNSTGPSWASIKSSIGSGSTYYISAIAVQPGNSDVIWVGHNNGNVYKTTNGTQASPIWTQVDTNGATPLPNRYVSRIVVDPNSVNTVYVTFGGYGQYFNSDNVWRTVDGGANWSARSGSGGTALPVAPVRSLAIYPTNSNWLYVGTEVGVFASENAGASWSGTNDGPANVSVDELFWMGTKLVAATHGRGLFSIIPGSYNLNLPLIQK
ncbi:MAG: hypothetical protein HZB51_04690 [Chloroflexi bacterium]|nr:hypothetical protein [Chloroflexota bacterium]